MLKVFKNTLIGFMVLLGLSIFIALLVVPFYLTWVNEDPRYLLILILPISYMIGLAIAKDGLI
jgi:hypothetical protein